MLKFAQMELERERAQMAELEQLQVKYRDKILWGLLILGIGIFDLIIAEFASFGTFIAGLIQTGIGGWWLIRWFINTDCALALFIGNALHLQTVPIRKRKCMAQIRETLHRIDWLRDRDTWKEEIYREKKESNICGKSDY